ncbi:MAG: hypothetical protein ABII64_02845 [Elusimicrobiota bacterium]
MPEEQLKITPQNLQDSRIETIFYVTLLITVVHSGFIIWDTGNMALRRANEIVATGYMSTLYLAFLGAYAGYKEFVRWIKPAKTLTTEDEDVLIPKSQVLRYRRGEIIVVFWVLLLMTGISLFQLKLIERLPQELYRTAMQAVGIWLGTMASKGLSQRKKRKDSELLDDDLKYEQVILKHIGTTGFVDNASCQEITGLDRNRAYRLLRKLASDGKLKTEGGTKGARYLRTE